MKNKSGFTLTEVLLAVMVVGLIGVALASLTTVCDNKTMLGATIPSVSGMGCVTYSFEKGSATGSESRSNKVVPSSATRGGIIKRNGDTVLRNVKYVNNYEGYSSPYFRRVGTGTAGSALDITIITELDSTPPVNDIVEETFLLPNGL